MYKPLVKYYFFLLCIGIKKSLTLFLYEKEDTYKSPRINPDSEHKTYVAREKRENISIV